MTFMPRGGFQPHTGFWILTAQWTQGVRRQKDIKKAPIVNIGASNLVGEIGLRLTKLLNQRRHCVIEESTSTNKSA